MLIIDLVPHMDAGDRARWRGDQNQRPLSELGRRQAEAIADALAREPVDALYASPALRCRQTLEPLARRLGLEIAVLDDLREIPGWVGPEPWMTGPLGGAYAAGRALRAVERMRASHGRGRIVAASHGDVIPAAVAQLAGAHELRVPELKGRGQWYRLRYDGPSLGIELCEAGKGFSG